MGVSYGMLQSLAFSTARHEAEASTSFPHTAPALGSFTDMNMCSPGDRKKATFENNKHGVKSETLSLFSCYHILSIRLRSDKKPVPSVSFCRGFHATRGCIPQCTARKPRESTIHRTDAPPSEQVNKARHLREMHEPLTAKTVFRRDHTGVSSGEITSTSMLRWRGSGGAGGKSRSHSMHLFEV